MTTVAQLIKVLETLPQDAIVEVLTENNECFYTTTEFRPVDIDNGAVDVFTVMVGGTELTYVQLIAKEKI